jgi:5-methylcytosine-specific restriction endonuclease McrA
MARRPAYSGPELVFAWFAFRLLPGVLKMIWRSIRDRARPRKAKQARRRMPPGWSKARMKVFSRNRAANGGIIRCEQCRRTEADGVAAWHVHHLRSRKHWPELEVDPDNLAIWCRACNLGASNDYAGPELAPCPRKAA